MSRRPSGRRSPRVRPVARQRRASATRWRRSRRSSRTASATCLEAKPGCPSRCSSPAATGRSRARTRRSSRTGSRARRPPSSTPPTSTISRSWLASTANRDWRSSATASPGIELTPQSGLDATVPLSRVTFADAEVEAVVERELGETIIDRLITVGGLLAAAEAIGAAAGIFAAARAATRPSAGNSVGRSEATRRCAIFMADLHVRQASGWSTTLFAAAALDDGMPGARQTASVAKAYVSTRRARGRARLDAGLRGHRVHRGAPAHRFLRRIIVREQQFGDAAHHERELGRSLAAGASRNRWRCDRHRRARLRRSDRTTSGADHHGRRPGDRRTACSPTSCTTRAGASATSRSSPAASPT